MTALIALSMLATAFLCAGVKHRLAELDRAQRFERLKRQEEWRDRTLEVFWGRVERNLAHRKAQRQVRSERAKRGWNTRRAA